MVQYDLDHLTQDDSQRVLGPIQDDEALFLFAVVRGMRMRRVMEIGGQSGYSARNFVKAFAPSMRDECTVYTVDFNPVQREAPNHVCIQKNAKDLVASDFDSLPLDMVFFDCHDDVQMEVYHMLRREGIVTDDTVLALHDTNLHFPPHNVWGTFIPEMNGFAHQEVERRMVNAFKAMGYDCFMLHTTSDKHSDAFPFRHGVTICQMSRALL